MNDIGLQSTLRQVRAHFRDRRAWGVLAILSLVVGLVGPFGTFAAMPLLIRIVYWSVTVVGTYAIGVTGAVSIGNVLGARVPAPVRLLLCGLIPGIVIALFVFALNAVAFGVEGIALLELLVYCPLIALAVTAGFALFERGSNAGAQGEPAILKRVQLPQRGRLLALTVSDHYVEIVTDKGTSLVLMRLSDAIAETEGVPGLQVHRSHWVALDAVKRVYRKSGKLMLELSNGSEVPVSRSYQEAAREAGLAS